MLRTLKLLLAAAMVAGLFAVPATAEVDDPCRDEEGELVLTEEQVYIKDPGTKAGNLAATPAQDFPTWDTEAPTDSVQDGAGGGYLGHRAADIIVTSQEPWAAATFEGTFEGCIDTIAAELYAAVPANAAGYRNNYFVRARLVIDDVVIYQTTDATGPEVNADENPHGDATHRIRFAFTELAQILDWDLDDPAGEHTVRISVTPQYVDTNNAIFFYDTTEVPSGFVFNAEDLSEFTAIPVW